MNHLPLHVPLVFLGAAIFTLFFLYKAFKNKKTVLLVSLLWLGVQAAIGLSGFYTVTDTMPPRFLLLIVPPLVLIATFFFTGKGKKVLDNLDTKWLTILHVVRIPVEAVLFWLFVHNYVPELMTFEGRNLDILSGLTAPIMYYLVFVRKSAGRKTMLAWNLVCLALLLNIVINAILAAPFPFQQFAFDQPNVGILYFPFIWLPGFIVPAVLLSHLAGIRRLLQQKEGQPVKEDKVPATAYTPSY